MVTLAPSETLRIPVLDKSSGMQKLPAPEPVAKFLTNPRVELVKLSKDVGFCAAESEKVTDYRINKWKWLRTVSTSTYDSSWDVPSAA
jgi:hypothetical protein